MRIIGLEADVRCRSEAPRSSIWVSASTREKSSSRSVCSVDCRPVSAEPSCPKVAAECGLSAVSCTVRPIAPGAGPRSAGSQGAFEGGATVAAVGSGTVSGMVSTLVGTGCGGAGDVSGSGSNASGRKVCGADSG